ncbi:MAG: prephenate dehydrogenase/arogenate dehydrogenase family protein, partial [Verrucomicrobia bacterium]|nr:prephenate dehydrogenase/arogenate dehydrogenase family protein [Verrucomicrobiota bacterium]
VAEAAGAWFVGSHPMAGSERTGFEAARADLFEGAVCAVTPTDRTHGPAREEIEALWAAVGSEVLTLSPVQHDELVGRSSHLPHVVAAGLASYVLSPAHAPVQAMLCASGFRDTTRIAGGAPEMWRDIALANGTHLARALGVLMADLREFQQALEERDAAAVEEFFRKARARRESWLAGGRSGQGESSPSSSAAA